MCTLGGDGGDRRPAGCVLGGVSARRAPHLLPVVLASLLCTGLAGPQSQGSMFAAIGVQEGIGGDERTCQKVGSRAHVLHFKDRMRDDAATAMPHMCPGRQGPRPLLLAS